MLVSELIEQIRFNTLVINDNPLAWLNYTEDQLLDLVKINAPLFSRKIGALSLDSEIDESVASLVLLKSQIDICYRMSMGEARNYPLMAEGSSLRKDYIFEHYMSLIRSLKDDLRYIHEEYKRGTPINVSRVIRNSAKDPRLDVSYPNAEVLNHNPLVGGIELTWSKFNYKLGGYFYKYSLLLLEGSSVGYDSIKKQLPTDVLECFDYYNPLSTGERILNLEPATDYKLLLVVYNALGMFSVDTLEFTTL